MYAGAAGSHSIVSLYNGKCIPSFNELCTVLEELQGDPGPRASLPLVNDQFGRLRAWGSHSGAHRPETSKLSLDYRLREASHMRSRIIGFLAELDRDLQQAIIVLKHGTGNEVGIGQQLPGNSAWEDSSDDSDSSSETDSTASVLLKDSRQEPEPEPEREREPEREPEPEPEPATRPPEGEAPSSCIEQQNPEPCPPKKSRFEYLLDDITHIITCLYTLSITIQNPAARDQLHKYKNIDVKHFEAFELLHVWDKFPKAAPFLVERLVKANLRRRQRLEYYRGHHLRIIGKDYPDERQLRAQPEEILNVLPEKSISQHPPPTAVDKGPRTVQARSAPSVSTAINSHTTISTYVEVFRIQEASYDHDPLALIEVQSEAGCSQTSFATSASGTSQLYIPTPPRNLNGTPFACPYCFYIIRPKNSFYWLRHVVQDLQPYVCTFEDCTKPDRLFSKREDWYDHETQVHRRHWFCMKCTIGFSSPKLLKQHLIATHQHLPEELDLVTQRCEGPIQTAQSCPFGCDGFYLTSALRGHLARHMQEIALFSLPRFAYGDEDKTQNSASVQASWGDVGDLEDLPPSEDGSASAQSDATTNREGIDANGKTGLYYAAKAGHVDRVKELITNGGDIPAEDGRTALHLLAIEGDSIAVRIVLEAMAVKNVDPEDKNGMTPLHLAVKHLNAAVVYILLENGASPDTQDSSGRTALQFLEHHQSKDLDGSQAHKDLVDGLVWLLRQEKIIQKDGKEQSAFHHAAAIGSPEMLERLWGLVAGYEQEEATDRTTLYHIQRRTRQNFASMLLDMKGRTGWAPLHLAAGHGHERTVQLLLQKGASVDIKKNDEWTPLHLAANNNHERTVDILLENGASVDVKENEGWTPLHLVAGHGFQHIAQMLLEKGASVDVKDNDEWTPLHLAAKNDHGRPVQMLLKQGANVDAKEKEGWTPLHLAANNNHEHIVQILLENGASVNVKEREGWTSLHLAAGHGHERTVQLLLEKGASVDIKENDELTPLHLAANNNHERIVQILLENGASVDMKGNEGRTPLHLAAGHGYQHIAQMLLEKGASMDVKESEGRTPLHLAAGHGYQHIAQMLLEKGASVDVKENKGRTPLHVAANNNHEVIVQILLENGASVNVKENEGRTPLHLVAGHGYQHIAQMLLEKGASVDVKDNDEWTPLNLAANNNHERTVDILLENGASVSVKEKEGWTSLHLAAGHGHERTVQLLLQKGASVDIKKNDEWTPLHIAANNNHERIVDILLENGASVNVKEKEGWTSLHLAAGHGYQHIAQMLLEKGASVDLKDNDEWSPLHLAAGHGNERIVQLLLEKGASVNVKEKGGWSPLDLATGHNHEHVVRMLLEKEATADVN